MHTRLLVLIASAALTFAAGVTSETSTYIDGTLPGISPNTGGTLVLSDAKALSFRTGLTTVSINYAQVTHVELGATKETSHDVPVYKVWALHKRLGGKTQTQLLVVNFKDETGSDKSMTLEVAKSSANSVLSTIKSRTTEQPVAEKTVVASADQAPASQASEAPKVATNEPVKSKKELKEEAKLEAKAAKHEAKEEKTAAKSEKPGEWWGDGYWKTTRNADKWSQKSPAPTTPNNNN